MTETAPTDMRPRVAKSAEGMMWRIQEVKRLLKTYLHIARYS